MDQHSELPSSTTQDDIAEEDSATSGERLLSYMLPDLPPSMLHPETGTIRKTPVDSPFKLVEPISPRNMKLESSPRPGPLFAPPKPLNVALTLDEPSSFRDRANTWHGRPAEQVMDRDKSKSPLSGLPTVGEAAKKTASRRNPWGNSSYADLITQAILSSAERRLTLSQIYDWMVANVEFFRDKKDNNSSAGWKVSVPSFNRLSTIFSWLVFHIYVVWRFAQRERSFNPSGLTHVVYFQHCIIWT